LSGKTLVNRILLHITAASSQVFLFIFLSPENSLLPFSKSAEKVREYSMRNQTCRPETIRTDFAKEHKEEEE
jgi:hypothetical protein